VLAAVKSRGAALEFASDELQTDQEVVLEAVKADGRALEFASAELQADREVVLEAVKSDGAALPFAAEKLQADPEVLAAVKPPSLQLIGLQQLMPAESQLLLHGWMFESMLGGDL